MNIILVSMLVLAEKLFSEINTWTLCGTLNAHLDFFLLVICGLGCTIMNLISRLRSVQPWCNRSGDIRWLISSILVIQLQWLLPCIDVKAISSPCVADGPISFLSLGSGATLGNWVSLDACRPFNDIIFTSLTPNSDIGIRFWFFKCFSFHFGYIRALKVTEGWVLTAILAVCIVELLESFGLFALDGILLLHIFHLFH